MTILLSLAFLTLGKGFVLIQSFIKKLTQIFAVYYETRRCLLHLYFNPLKLKELSETVCRWFVNALSFCTSQELDFKNISKTSERRLYI